MKKTIFDGIDELKFVSLLFAILYYQSMIVETTIAHINYALANNLHFFYVEDISHLIVYLEIMTFAANLMTNIIIVLIASFIDIKLIKMTFTEERRKKLELGFL